MLICNFGNQIKDGIQFFTENSNFIQIIFNIEVQFIRKLNLRRSKIETEFEIFDMKDS